MTGFTGRRVVLVGPVPPPDGGMANQTAQLARLLQQEGADVRIVAVNAPYRPAWIGRVPLLRAFARLLPYLATLRRETADVDVVHVMANSGWSWHLGAAPAVWIASGRHVPVVVNYRGGGAGEFFQKAMTWVRPTLRRCAAIVVPSPFLQRVFEAHGFHAAVVPNIVDLTRFHPADGARSADRGAPHLVVTRHLEPIYDNATAIAALGRLRAHYPGATLTIAGAGPERERLLALARNAALSDAVTFTGRLDNDQVAALYRRADVAINPSLVDNMPISVLEALASGVPVVSTNVGGVPDLVRDGVTARLVPPREPASIAGAVREILENDTRREELIRAGLELARRFSWERVREEWAAVYERAARGTKG